MRNEKDRGRETGATARVMRSSRLSRMTTVWRFIDIWQITIIIICYHYSHNYNCYYTERFDDSLHYCFPSSFKVLGRCFFMFVISRFQLVGSGPQVGHFREINGGLFEKRRISVGCSQVWERVHEWNHCYTIIPCLLILWEMMKNLPYSSSTVSRTEIWT